MQHVKPDLICVCLRERTDLLELLDDRFGTERLRCDLPKAIALSQPAKNASVVWFVLRRQCLNPSILLKPQTESRLGISYCKQHAKSDPAADPRSGLGRHKREDQVAMDGGLVD